MPWNAMYWGFGLEGVGQAGADTVSRDRLLGDTFNFLVKNVVPMVVVRAAANGQDVLTVDLGPTAAPLRFIRAEVSRADGRTETVHYSTPQNAAAVRFTSGGTTDMPSDRVTEIKLIPVPGTAAPVYVTVAAP